MIELVSFTKTVLLILVSWIVKWSEIADETIIFETGGN